MLIKKPADIPASEITDERIYLRRREFIQLGAGLVGAAAGGMLAACGRDALDASGAGTAPAITAPQTGITDIKKKMVTTTEPLNTFEQITTYNNYYEFGTSKDQPARHAAQLKTSPWTVKIDGLCNKPADYHLEDLIKSSDLEERVYRFRCVEAWSMVIPWVGIPLASVIKRADPQPKATFVEFTTVLRPSEMPGLATGGLNWPYTEGLRMDEAMNPLTLLAVGLYGKTLLNQNGAPIRLVIPWKYGFKGAKSLVRIRFVDKMPRTAWNDANSSEYGFYSNVNPNVDHPRWSQATERRIPGYFKTTKTLMFNGYADQVASMYAGMDLRKWY
ncbi:MAG TPA: protein-methionine-sulfoxide reductase catalytic subunit MsrP [Vicinamibacterales bacterium]|jgi:sulfoxide reductase catalytic subunit YedY|nr:protein-methionine-sulfoxide reductase catalytic subunit MsrP [Vicinamibacterales bacterium]